MQGKRRRRGRGWLAALLLIAVLAGAAYLIQDIQPAVQVKTVILASDGDRDGVPDLEDLVQGARLSVKNRTEYKSGYYEGGYPPEKEGVCTDVIWRAFQHAGYDLKSLVDKDIAADSSAYPRVNGAPDPNIDFRRAANLDVFFSRKAAVLTMKLVPGDPNNLVQWQGGDIVVVKEGDQYHIAMLSDKRNQKGVPLVIHHPGGLPREEDCLERWQNLMVGHYRFPTEG